MLEQRQHAVADQIDCRLVSGDDEQEDGRNELGLVEGISTLLGLHQAARQITARMGALVGQQRFDILDKHLQSRDRKSTRLNSSHSQISYAVFCLKKKNETLHQSSYSQHVPSH